MELISTWKPTLYLAVGICIVSTLWRLARSGSESSLSATNNEKLDDLQLPNGVRLIHLASPLCFMALSRAAHLLLDGKTKIVLLYIQKDYQPSGIDISSIDIAVQEFKKLDIEPILISERYEEIFSEMQGDTTSEVAFARTFEEGRKIALQLNELLT